MKIKNRKKLNAFIAIFMVVFMAGSAFALTSQGALLFNGTVHANADLELNIVEFFPIGASDPQPRSLHADEEIVIDSPWLHWEILPGNRAAEFDIEFFRPNQHITFATVIRNVGTTHADIYDLDLFSYAAVPGVTFRVEIHEDEDWGSPSNILVPGGTHPVVTLEPGQELWARITTEFLADGPIPGHVIDTGLTQPAAYRLSVDYRAALSLWD